jgi:hypothetical protein
MSQSHLAEAGSGTSLNGEGAVKLHKLLKYSVLRSMAKIKSAAMPMNSVSVLLPTPSNMDLRERLPEGKQKESTIGVYIPTLDPLKR